MTFEINKIYQFLIINHAIKNVIYIEFFSFLKIICVKLKLKFIFYGGAVFDQKMIYAIEKIFKYQLLTQF